MTEIKITYSRGEEKIQLKCPTCGAWTEVNEDQVQGLFPIVCLSCGTNWKEEDGVNGIEAEVIVDD